MAGTDPTSTQVHSREYRRVLPVLVALKRIEQPTIARLASGVELTDRQIKSCLMTLQRNYQVMIERSPIDGSLIVRSWGTIDSQFFSSSEE